MIDIVNLIVPSTGRREWLACLCVSLFLHIWRKQRRENPHLKIYTTHMHTPSSWALTWGCQWPFLSACSSSWLILCNFFNYLEIWLMLQSHLLKHTGADADGMHVTLKCKQSHLSLLEKKHRPIFWSYALLVRRMKQTEISAVCSWLTDKSEAVSDDIFYYLWYLHRLLWFQLDRNNWSVKMFLLDQPAAFSVSMALYPTWQKREEEDPIILADSCCLLHRFH